MALRWRKAKRSGRMTSPERFELRDRADGPVLMNVQSVGGGLGWFFYGLGANSAGQGAIAKLEAAKQMAEDHARRSIPNAPAPSAPPHLPGRAGSGPRRGGS